MRKRFVVEMTFTAAPDGTTETLYAATSGFFTRSGDVPANTHIPGALKSAGSLRRELFSGARVTGGVRPSFGNVSIVNSDGAFDALIGYGTGGRLVVRWGPEDGAYPGDYETVYIAYVYSVLADFDEVTIRLRDRLQLLDKPVVQSGFAGTGGVEGNGGVSALKQWLSGDPAYFPPILIDHTKQLYYVQETSTGGLHSYVELYEGGVPITRGADYTSEAEMLATAPSSGQCRFYFGPLSGSIHLGPVYFRLAGTPAYPLRVYSLGYPPVAPQWSFAAMAERAGVPTADILPAATGTSVYSVLVDDDRTYLDVMDNASTADTQFYGFTRLDQFTGGILSDPSNGTSLYTFTRHNAGSFRRTPVDGMENPIWKLTVRSGETWPCETAGSASATLVDYLTREWWWTFSGESTTTQTAHPGAITASIEVLPRRFQNQFSIDNFLSRYFALYGGRRDFYTFTVPMSAEVLALELHDVVTLQLPRFGLDAGKKFRVVTIQIDCGGAGRDPSITLGVWGGETGEYTGSGVPGLPTASDDPVAVQSEIPADLLTEDGLTILIETDESFLATEIDAAFLTETGALLLTET